MGENKNETELTKKTERDKFLNQSNNISLAPIKTHSALSSKLITYGMYRIAKVFDIDKYKGRDLFEEENWNGIDWKDFTCEFKTSDFFTALDMKDGGHQRILIAQAIDEIFGEKILLGDENQTTYIHWFVKAVYYHPKGMIGKLNNIKMNDDFKLKLIFHPAVITIALDNKFKYTHIKLKAIGKLKSYYAIKWYEIILSYYNMKGKYQNKNDYWDTEPMTISKIKKLFDIDADSYKNRINNFLDKVVKKPINEINNAFPNFSVEVIYNRGYRNAVDSVYFRCYEKVLGKLPNKLNTSEEKAAMEEQVDIQSVIEYFKDKYPDEFHKQLEELKKARGETLMGFDILLEQEVCEVLKQNGFN